MAEHDAERAGSEEEREPRPTEGAAVPDGGAGAQDAPARPRGEGDPIDEAAVWEAIVAGYGEEPPDPPGAKPFKSIDDLAQLEDDQRNVLDPDKGAGKQGPPKPPEKPLGSSVVFAPGVNGPRDYEVTEPPTGTTRTTTTRGISSRRSRRRCRRPTSRRSSPGSRSSAGRYCC